MAAPRQGRPARGTRKAPRAIWSGSIGFGLVNVPVRMYSAVDEQDLRFHLLHRRDDGRIGYEKVCKYVIREKQHLGCLRIRDGVILLEKMYFADEIRPTDGIAAAGVRVSKREREMARELIDRLSGSFDIAKYRDDYRDALLEVIDAKRRGKEVHVDRERPPEAPDLVEALRASLEAHRGRRDSRNGSNGRLASLSKDELVRRARERGIEGYSKLRNDELVEALSPG